MEEITLNAEGTTLLQKTIRYGLVTVGGFIFIAPQYFIEGKLIFAIKILGILLATFAIVNPYSIMGQNRKLILTDDFIQGTEESVHFIEFLLKLASKSKTTEQMTTTHTVYWNTVNKVFLTKYALRIYHGSGIYEDFRIPHTDQVELEKVQSKIIEKSNEHNFSLEKKPWWKILC